MAKIIVFGDIDINPLYVSVDGRSEMKISGKVPRSITVSAGTHEISVTTVSRVQRAMSSPSTDFLSSLGNAMEDGANTTLEGRISFNNDDVLLLQSKQAGLKSKIFNKVVSSREANDYVQMSSVIEYGEKAPGEKNKWVALILCLFFGVLGVHRFYEGKIGTGILYLLTLGLCGIGVIVDFFKILSR